MSRCICFRFQDMTENLPFADLASRVVNNENTRCPRCSLAISALLKVCSEPPREHSNRHNKR